MTGLRRERETTIAALVEACLDPALRRKGFGSMAVHRNWNEIVGRDLARHSEPIDLKWPPQRRGAPETSDAAATDRAPDGRAAGAVLTVNVSGAFALEFQQSIPVVLERVNAHLGWGCVSRIAIRQTPVRKARPEPIAPLPVVDAEASRRLDRLIEGVEDKALRRALLRLGVGVLGRRPGP